MNEKQSENEKKSALDLAVEQLTSGNCQLYISLFGKEIGDEGAKAIAQALQSGKCPTGLKIDLRENRIRAEGAKAIAQALQSGKCPTGLKIDLSDNLIGYEGAKAIAQALQSGKCPDGLEINLTDSVKEIIQKKNELEEKYRQQGISFQCRLIFSNENPLDQIKKFIDTYAKVPIKSIEWECQQYIIFCLYA